MQSSVLYCKKAYNYLNIKEKNLDIYFRIALMVSQRSLWTEFATMSILSLPQSKSVFLRSSRDLVVNVVHNCCQHLSPRKSCPTISSFCRHQTPHYTVLRITPRNPHRAQAQHYLRICRLGRLLRSPAH